MILRNEQTFHQGGGGKLVREDVRNTENKITNKMKRKSRAGWGRGKKIKKDKEKQ